MGVWVTEKNFLFFLKVFLTLGTESLIPVTPVTPVTDVPIAEQTKWTLNAQLNARNDQEIYSFRKSAGRVTPNMYYGCINPASYAGSDFICATEIVIYILIFGAF